MAYATNFYNYGYKHTKNQLVLEDFTHGDADRVFVDHREYKNARSCCNSLNASAKNLHLCAKAVVENGNVYLIRTFGQC